MPPMQGIPPEHLAGIQDCLQTQSPNYPHSVSTPGACAEARIVARYLHETFPAIRTLVDVGTAGGHFPMAWLELGLFAIGLDAHPDAPLTLGAPILLRDAGLPLDVLPQADAVTCWDCGEHLPESKAEQLVKNLCLMAPLVFFSSDDKPGAQGHQNCKPPEWWELIFKRHGYRRWLKWEQYPPVYLERRPTVSFYPPMQDSYTVHLDWYDWRMGLKKRIEDSPVGESYLYWIWTDASCLYVRV